ncbi:bifunctional DedA family/phosphatase PAP2 family protein [Pseudomonas typographi]|uniref:bifunctional DedA family/phosphatase PAP2 family protein n=1 Tax=Pseudomonas typographi TaxID=2715964 RepID=UPI00168496A5|nr:bifunctional DedA family/phosphatase PAP2 family protein [Pseudomonas typographi]MBD1553461.1 phosphatase PAP2 family protein [Pseudomonas typographi]MBD1589002.1 phosphatase PAP2 family protein [Pseudomonas typographi]
MQWLDALDAWLAANPHWLGGTIFVVACIECLAIAGVIVPGTVVLFAIAALAGRGHLGLGETLLLGYLGGLLGDALSYAIGRSLQQNIRRLPGLRSHPQWLARAEGYVERYGVASLLVGRFIGPLRPMLPMVAGMLEMPIPRFALASLVAAAGWAVAYLLPGWAAGAAVRLPLPAGFWPQAAVVAAGMALLVGLSAYSAWYRHARTTLLVAACSFALLLALLVGWPYLSALDQGLSALIQEHRSAVLDHWVVMVTRLGDFRTQLYLGGLLVAVLLLGRQWRPALFASSTLLATAIANTVLKALFGRARPEVLADPLGSYSMPSGHSSGAFALFLTLAVLASRGQPPRMRLACTFIACIPALAIASSRVYLGVHWPTDVIAGILLAASGCAASFAVSQRFYRLAPVPLRVWWMLAPVFVAWLFSALHALPHAVMRYEY